MLSLRVKLALALIVTSLIGVGIVAIVVQRLTTREFENYVQDQQQADFADQMALLYASVNPDPTTGTWDTVTANFRPRQQLTPSVGPPPAGNPGGPVISIPVEDNYLVINLDYVVVFPPDAPRAGEQINNNAQTRQAPIEVDSIVVGYVIPAGPPPPRDARAEAYITRINQALAAAAISALTIALIISLLFARSLAKPIRELTQAISAMAGGELAQQVAVRSGDELGQLASAFNQMSTDLAHANNLRRQMTADIAHDLRTPLTVITGYLESLRDGVLAATPERFATMHHEALQLQRLVEDLRTLSLADAGELPLNREPVTLAHLLDNVAAAFAPQVAAQNIALQMDIQPDLPPVALDPDRITQVLGNLISNALRYTPVGGHIRLGARAELDQVVLRVDDSGSGIAPEHLPHIFERFYQIDEARQQQSGESGLGLAIAKSIVEAHGGTIEAMSGPAGTTFTIALPVTGG